VSHETVRRWIIRLSKVMRLDVPKRPRRLIALDEARVVIRGAEVFVWSAIDCETREVLGIMVTRKRRSKGASDFIMMVLRTCSEDVEPRFLVDGVHGFRRL
jgi:transposase-like protein